MGDGGVAEALPEEESFPISRWMFAARPYRRASACLGSGFGGLLCERRDFGCGVTRLSHRVASRQAFSGSRLIRRSRLRLRPGHRIHEYRPAGLPRFLSGSIFSCCGACGAGDASDGTGPCAGAGAGVDTATSVEAGVDTAAGSGSTVSSCCVSGSKPSPSMTKDSGTSWSSDRGTPVMMMTGPSLPTSTCSFGRPNERSRMEFAATTRTAHGASWSRTHSTSLSNASRECARARRSNPAYALLWPVLPDSLASRAGGRWCRDLRSSGAWLPLCPL